MPLLKSLISISPLPILSTSPSLPLDIVTEEGFKWPELPADHAPDMHYAGWPNLPYLEFCPCFGSHKPLFSDHILPLDRWCPRPKTLSITNLRSGADISLSDKSNPIWSKLTGLHRFLCEFSLAGRAAKWRQNLGGFQPMLIQNNFSSATLSPFLSTPFVFNAVSLAFEGTISKGFSFIQNWLPLKTEHVPSWKILTYFEQASFLAISFLSFSFKRNDTPYNQI